MTRDEIQAFATATAELIGAKFDAMRSELLAEVQGARAAAERAADHGIEAATRLDRLETTQNKHAALLDSHSHDLQQIGERLARLEGAAE